MEMFLVLIAQQRRGVYLLIGMHTQESHALSTLLWTLRVGSSQVKVYRTVGRSSTNGWQRVETAR